MKLEKDGIVATVDSRGWRKSSLSGPYSDNCVEVAHTDGGELVGVRDSKDPGGAVLTFTRSEWNAFTGGTRNGEFDA